jgi:hypothetical protein
MQTKSTRPTARRQRTAAEADDNSNPNPILEAALAYADGSLLGIRLHIFPEPPGEKRSYIAGANSPLGTRWGATNDGSVLREYWDRFPDANVAVACEESGIFVIEADTPKGHNVDGIASLKALTDKHGPLPETRMAQSPSGSVHHYFNYPVGRKVWNSASVIAPGVDVRGWGGMAIAPPSKRGDGEYVWLNDAPIADAPDWLLALVCTAKKKKSKLDEACAEIAATAEGRRNDVLNAVTYGLAKLVKRGQLEEKTVRERLADAALRAGLEDREIAATLDSAFNASKAQGDALPVRWLLEDKPPPEPEWLVKQMIPRRGIGLLSAGWGEGKTFVAIDLALSVVSGKPFADRRTRPAGVLYLAPERPTELHRRAHFAAAQRGLKNIAFAWHSSCPKLTDDGALDTLVATAQAVDDEMQERHGVGLGLVIIDTMIVAGWGDENDSQSVQQVMQVLRGLSEAMGCFCLGIDHHGKDKERGTRGSSDKESSSDVVLTLADSVMTLRKVSEGLQGIELKFALKVHPAGVDADGDPVTKCTVGWLGAVEARDPTVQARAALVRAAMAKARTSNVYVNGANVEAVKRDDVRDLFIAALKKGTAESKRQQWKRACDAAIKGGGVKAWQEYLYVPGQGLPSRPRGRLWTPGMRHVKDPDQPPRRKAQQKVVYLPNMDRVREPKSRP